MSAVLMEWGVCQYYELAERQNDVNINGEALNNGAIDGIVLRLK
jgi:hypothetical protein